MMHGHPLPSARPTFPAPTITMFMSCPLSLIPASKALCVTGSVCPEPRALAGLARPMERGRCNHVRLPHECARKIVALSTGASAPRSPQTCPNESASAVPLAHGSTPARLRQRCQKKARATARAEGMNGGRCGASSADTNCEIMLLARKYNRKKYRRAAKK
jgi:hypothetical protein